MIEGVKKDAGVIGAGVAQVFATAGYPVKLQDIAAAAVE